MRKGLHIGSLCSAMRTLRFSTQCLSAAAHIGLRQWQPRKELCAALHFLSCMTILTFEPLQRSRGASKPRGIRKDELQAARV